MRWYTHVVGALLLYLILAFLFNLDITLISIFFAGWISIFPDIMDWLSGKHRGIGHSIFWVVPFILIGFLDSGIAFALIVGISSHIFLDIFTKHGSPMLYPLIKTSFVSLNIRNRIKTNTNREKAVFIFFILLLIPTVLLITGNLSRWSLPGDNTTIATGEASGVPQNTHNIQTSGKNGVNLNFQINSNARKNITIQEEDNRTNVIVDDLK